MGIIHVCTGQKGGVGKTFLAKILHEYLTCIKANFYLYDLDAGSHDVGRVYAGDRYSSDNATDDAKLQFSDNRNRKDEVDTIFAKAIEQDVLINLPSNIKHLYNPWVENNGLIDLAKDNGIRFISWFVCSGEEGSISEFIQAAQKFKNCDHYRHVFVQNYGFEDDWAKIMDANKTLKDLIEADGITKLDLPDLSPTRYKKILDNNLTFSAAKDSKHLNLVDKSAVKQYLDKCQSNLDGVFEDLGLLAVAGDKKKWRLQIIG